jgi:hypothetical protein
VSPVFPNHDVLLRTVIAAWREIVSVGQSVGDQGVANRYAVQLTSVVPGPVPAKYFVIVLNPIALR